MHGCPKVVTFQVFVDTGIEDAEHLNQVALAWNALLSSAVAGRKYTQAFLCTPDRRRAVLLRSNLIYFILFLAARRMIPEGSALLYWDEPFSPSRRQDKVTGNTELEDVLIGGLPNLQHPILQSIFEGLFLRCEATQTTHVIVTLILCIHSLLKENLSIEYTVK